MQILKKEFDLFEVMASDGKEEKLVEINSEFSILELKKAVAVAFSIPFNANADNFSIRIKDQNTLLGDNSQNVEVAGIFPGCFVMFAHEAPLDLIRVRVVKRKYQFEKENVKSDGF